ncbi:CGNR zinc finger domain-containing protein [Deinococcus sp.]|uniref:CGNR zinc finger domain-containing protein n=1 Tax=Deinococcus sp. TaxID=47478 RepID=UPI002869BF19|nr:CGNR zinc finger domain-containing protein [Deinococcus sp.]
MTASFLFLGGDISLDLVNTRLHRQQPGGADDLLLTSDDARAWLQAAGLASAEDLAALDGDSLLYGARRLRSALEGLYRPLAIDGVSQPGPCLATLNAVLAQARERSELALTPGGYALMRRTEFLGPPDPNVQVAQAAAALLHRLKPHRLRKCENPDCDLLFYDESRNGTRRWCSMQGCGNADKQARYRRARRAKPAG